MVASTTSISPLLTEAKVLAIFTAKYGDPSTYPAFTWQSPACSGNSSTIGAGTDVRPSAWAINASRTAAKTTVRRGDPSDLVEADHRQRHPRFSNQVGPGVQRLRGIRPPEADPEAVGRGLGQRGAVDARRQQQYAGLFDELGAHRLDAVGTEVPRKADAAAIGRGELEELGIPREEVG